MACGQHWGTGRRRGRRVSHQQRACSGTASSRAPGWFVGPFPAQSKTRPRKDSMRFDVPSHGVATSLCWAAGPPRGRSVAPVRGIPHGTLTWPASNTSGPPTCIWGSPYGAPPEKIGNSVCRAYRRCEIELGTSRAGTSVLGQQPLWKANNRPNANMWSVAGALDRNWSPAVVWSS